MRQYYSTIFSLHYDMKNNDESLAIVYKISFFINLKKSANFNMTTAAVPATATIC